MLNLICLISPKGFSDNFQSPAFRSRPPTPREDPTSCHRSQALHLEMEGHLTIAKCPSPLFPCRLRASNKSSWTPATPNRVFPTWARPRLSTRWPSSRSRETFALTLVRILERHFLEMKIMASLGYSECVRQDWLGFVRTVWVRAWNALCVLARACDF